MTVKADFTGAYRKIKGQKKIPLATGVQLTKFSGQAIKSLKRAVSGGILKTRSGHLIRNIGHKLSAGSDRYELSLGTGVGATSSVKYARIHDQPKGSKTTVKAKNVKYLTIPFPGVKGRARNFSDTFVIKSASGNLIIAQRKGKHGLKPLFLLKASVDIPGRYWFTGTLKGMRPLLNQFLSAEEILKVAMRLG